MAPTENTPAKEVRLGESDVHRFPVIVSDPLGWVSEDIKAMLTLYYSGRASK